jgi:hypothetical protein
MYARDIWIVERKLECENEAAWKAKPWKPVPFEEKMKGFMMAFDSEFEAINQLKQMDWTDYDYRVVRWFCEV